jgi:hypothetical protein
VAFETTVHFVPQRQSMQQGLMVKSTCSLTLKSDEDYSRGNSAFSLSRYPLASAPTLRHSSHSLAVAPNLSTGNETLWAALGNEAMAMAFKNSDMRDFSGLIKPLGRPSR